MEGRAIKKLMVSFRGTSEPRDVVTDASALTPWARGRRRERRHGDGVPLAAGDPSVPRASAGLWIPSPCA